MKLSLSILLTLSVGRLLAQDKPLPYYEIPPDPAVYSGCTVAARMIDGLGFRFYWATEGLRPVDLNYRPSKSGRTAMETIVHIYELSQIVVNATLRTPTLYGEKEASLPFDELRRKTLGNLKMASDQLKASSDSDLKEFNITFKHDTVTNTFPFWNELNGPIADALWHVGQVVSFRRASGNPYNASVDVFTGTVRKP